VTRRRIEARFTSDGSEIHADDGTSTRVYLSPSDLVSDVRRRDASSARRGSSTVTTIEWINVPLGFIPPEATP